MEDNNPIPEEWSESEREPFDEECSSSSETEREKVELYELIDNTAKKILKTTFRIIEKPVSTMEKASQITGNPSQIMDNPDETIESSDEIMANTDEIIESSDEIMGNPDEIMENPDPVIESPGHVMDNTGQIINNPVQIMENPVQIMENPTQIMDNSGIIIMENPIQFMDNSVIFMKNPVQIMDNPVIFMENPAQIIENSGQIMGNPAQNMENPGQIMGNPAQILENPIPNIGFVQNPPEPLEPTTTETKKRKLPEANQDTLAHYMLCQKFRLPNWNSIRYAGVKDQFQASPGFCALKPNDLLVDVIPDSKYNDLLRRFDLTCGAMVNGLLQNMQIFNETVNDLPKSMQNKVYKAFHCQESEYRKNSDGLLQYTCGRRQEIIQDRRKLYKPPNKIYKKALYEIPPSEIHLFEDEAFTNLVAQMKGIDNIFPTEKKRRVVYRKQRSNQNRENGNRRKTRQASNHQTRRPE